MVASSDELASNSGRDILKKGGNAVDASIATAFTLSVVLQGNIGNPPCYLSLPPKAHE